MTILKVHPLFKPYSQIGNNSLFPVLLIKRSITNQAEILTPVLRLYPRSCQRSARVQTDFGFSFDTVHRIDTVHISEGQMKEVGGGQRRTTAHIQMEQAKLIFKLWR